MTPERERVIELVNEYRRKRRLQWWSTFWSGFLAISLFLICMWIFFYAWPTVE